MKWCSRYISQSLCKMYTLIHTRIYHNFGLIIYIINDEAEVVLCCRRQRDGERKSEPETNTDRNHFSHTNEGEGERGFT